MKTNLRNWFLFSLLAVFSFSLASCGSDDEVTNTPSIIGKWQIEKINVNGMEIPQMGTAATLEFKKDGKVYAENFNFPGLNIFKQPVEYKYNDKDGTISLASINGKILKLTETELQFEGTMSILGGDVKAIIACKRVTTATTK